MLKINLVFLIIFSTFALAQSSKEEVKKTGELRKIENKAFTVGEKLSFDVNYGFVTAGLATMEIPQIKKISGREAYHVFFEVNSVPSFNWMFKVRDRYETYIDTEGIFPWRFEQHIREGNYSRDFAAFFDQRKNIVKTSNGEYVTPDYVHDIVSAFYYVRTLDYSGYKVNDKLHLQNFYKDKLYDLDVVYRGKETIEVPAGKFDCIIVEPLVKEGGLFKHDGNIVIWLSDDDLKVPIKVRTKIIIGYVEAVLTSYKGLAGEFTAKK
jgi:Protein of unknown function (DUF3108)